MGRRQKILDAAVTVMSRKGKRATISEIAAAAGVTDSVLYHYFQNKEDLLAYAAGDHLKSGLADLNWHLKGIRDPISRLSKFIWFQLYYHDQNPQYAYFTIFECRSKKSFFHHAAFEHFRQWTRGLGAILKDGVQQGVFPADLPVPVVRDMVSGLLDIENIQYFTGQMAGEAQADLDGIMNLLLPILAVRPLPENDKPQRILTAAEAIFADKGYDRATILEISRAAKVAEGTVYDYFKNKEDLFYSILRQRFQEHLESLGELFEIKTPLRKLRRFIRYHFSIYLNQPSFAKTFVLNGIFNHRFYESSAYADFQTYMQTLDTILDQGKADGSIRGSINNRIFKNLFLGTFSHMALRWLFVGQKFQIDKTTEINQAIEQLTRAAAGGAGREA